MLPIVMRSVGNMKIGGGDYSGYWRKVQKQNPC
jgi:hypothetical protein